MDKLEKKMCRKVQDLDGAGVQDLLKTWEMDEFVEFAVEKGLDGRKLMNVTEGIVKLWRPKINANKLILFTQQVKRDPEKYFCSLKVGTSANKTDLQDLKKETGKVIFKINYNKENTPVDIEEKAVIEVKTEEERILSIESQYQTVKKIKEDSVTVNNGNYQTVKKIKEDSLSVNNVVEYQTVKKTKEDSLSFSNIEDIIKRIVPAKSFLYRHQKKKTEVNSYLPMDAGTPKKRSIFRISGYDYPTFDLKRFSKPEGDRYYPMKRNSRFFIQKAKAPESRPKYNSFSTAEELKYPEDHFYEDLCYNDIENETGSISSGQVKPYRVKIQELFQSFKMPFFKKPEEVKEVQKEVEVVEERRVIVDEKEHMYENSDSLANMYDSVHVHNQDEHEKEANKTKLPVEDYLEPVQINKDYCDVHYKQKDESLLGYIMSIFESRFGIRRETNDAQTEDSEPDSPTDRWTDEPHHMADRPLPVPVENEPYYMDIDRHEAENLLKGQADGTFVLRPSSQSNHAYTLSVACASSVHNVGVRRRADGRLALGFARKGERSFADVTTLLRHHRKRRLLLVANGEVIGATTLNDTPQYYQTPCSIPVKII